MSSKETWCVVLKISALRYPPFYILRPKSAAASLVSWPRNLLSISPEEEASVWPRLIRHMIAIRAYRRLWHLRLPEVVRKYLSTTILSGVLQRFIDKYKEYKVLVKNSTPFEKSSEHADEQQFRKYEPPWETIIGIFKVDTFSSTHLAN